MVTKNIHKNLSTIIFLIIVIAFLSGTAVFAQPGIQNPGIQKAMEVQDRYTPELLSNSDVVGTATGLDKNGEPAIIVYTLTDKARGIPFSLEGVPVVIETTGMFIARSDPTAKFNRPSPIGVSAGHPDITAGTIGCRVTDGTNVYALSNNHVFANGNNATIGDSTLQPGPYDGGSDPVDKVGTLFDFVPMIYNDTSTVNYVDAAIATIDFMDFDGDGTDEYGVSTSTPADGYGIPGSAIYGDGNGDGFIDNKNHLLNLQVQKFGRTTGLTKGNVSEINVTVDVCYDCSGPFCFKCKKFARFEDQLGITPGNFSDGGDSGSLIVTDDTNKNPVGLLFAGSTSRTLANRIDLVLNEFNVDIDNQVTVPGEELGGGDSGSGNGNNGSEMYIWDISWSERHFGRGGSNTDLNITVDVNQDSDSDITAEEEDSAAVSANVTLVLTHDTDGDGFDAGDETWTLGGDTDSNGNVDFTLKFAPDGDYKVEVTNLTHSTLQWNSTLDADNPDFYYQLPNGSE